MGTDHQVALQLAAGGDQSSVHERAPAEGRLHAVAGEERGRRRRVGGAGLQRAEPPEPQLRAGRLRSTERLPDGVRLRAAIQDKRRFRTTRRCARSSATGRSTASIQLRLGHAVHDHGKRRRSEHARQHADGQPERLLQRDRRQGGRRVLLRSDGVQSADGNVRSGNTGRNQFRGPGYWNVDFSLFRAFPIGAADKRVEFRVEVFNLFNHPKWANPDADVTSATFGRTLRPDGGGGSRRTEGRPRLWQRRTSDTTGNPVPVLKRSRARAWWRAVALLLLCGPGLASHVGATQATDPDRRARGRRGGGDAGGPLRRCRHDLR